MSDMIETVRTNKTRLGNSIVQQNKLRKEYFQIVMVIKKIETREK